MLFSISRWKRELVENDERGGRTKSTRTEVNITTVANLFKKLPLNHIKNDGRIFEYPQECSSSDSERGSYRWISVLENFFCGTIMRPPTKLQVFANFWPPPKKNVRTLYHPPYFPDLSPPDYFLFPKLRMKLKGLHFADVAAIQVAVTNELTLRRLMSYIYIWSTHSWCF